MDITVDGLMEQARQLSLEEQAILSERLFEMLSPADPEWETERRGLDFSSLQHWYREA